MEAVLLSVAGVVAILGLLALSLSGRKGIFWLAFVATLLPFEFVDRYYLDLPGSVKWFPEVAMLAAATAAFVLHPGARAAVPRRLLVVYAVILAQALLSMVLNGSSSVALLLSQRGYLLLFGALIVMAAVRGLYDKERLHAFVLGAGLVSAVVCFLQRLTIGRAEPDRVTGLFSYGEVVLFYHLVCLGFVLAWWLEGRRVGGWHAGLATLVLLLSLAIGNQEAALPYFLVVLAYLFVRTRAKRGALLALGLALPVVLLGVFTLLYDTAYTSRAGSYSRAIFDLDYLQRYFLGEREDVLTPGGDLLRGAAIVTAWDEIAAERSTFLLGRGPGATSESGIAGASGALALAYPGIGRVTLSLLLGDVGLLGVLLFTGLLLVVLRSRPPPAGGEPHAHLMARELVVLLTLSYFVYARLTFEPCFAWILATVLQPPQALRQAPRRPSPGALERESGASVGSEMSRSA